MTDVKSVISSAQNDKVKELRKIVKTSKYRKELGVFITEGIRMFVEIPKERIRQICISESALKDYSEELKEYISDDSINGFVVKDSVFEGISDTASPQGVMAVVEAVNYTIDDIFGENPFILILDRIQDPGNLGTIIRTAEGAGVTGIVLGNSCVDIYNPKTVRSTMGSVFRMPMYVCSDICRDIEIIKARGVKVYGTHLDGNDFYEENYNEPCAFLVGNEGNGLSREVSDMADCLIKIPMKGRVESLNAAVSTAVVAYEVLRQRSIL